jgi:murein DD-endopeptidase MepM/ murein hydrolase activator NlpD
MVLALAVLLCLLLPGYAAFTAWSWREAGWAQWGLKVVAAAGYMGFLSYVARWDFISTYLPLFWWALIAMGALAGLVAMRGRTATEGAKVRDLLVATIEPAIAVALFAYAASAMLHPPATEAGFPLTGGRFLVVHGGSNPMLNYHNGQSRAQRYAVDIVAIDDFGRRAAGIDPADLNLYVSDGAPVRSPCAGEVKAAVDGIPDNAIGVTNTEVPAGNHVIVACGDIEVELAHLKQGTIAVIAGQRVSFGRTLGQAGNSGNSSEPHLHIHAVRAGTDEGVPLTFGGVFPVRNTVIAR